MEPHLATAYSLTLTGGLASDILGELGGTGHLVTAWGFDPPVFFRCWKLTLWGPRVSVLPNWGWWLTVTPLWDG